MIATYFILILYCMNCNPAVAIRVHDIQAYNGGDSQWADLNCRRLGDILSGDYRRRNMNDGTVVGQIAATKDQIIYTCIPETGEF